ncbi:DUF3784 domain-containing protein [Cytobacillus sp. FJAT-54145]|uniref:DUF3784 domain-containing protein n=1 Tax=Cytobacillus spartinae TaxID=3299023 RepID=A0ABW6K800_9BACI
MSAVFFIQLFIALLLFLIGWGIRKKETYDLISGFATRPREEQEELINNGYVKKATMLLMTTGIGMLILLPLSFTPFPFSIEVQFGFLLVYLLGGTIYLSKYEVEKKRKRSYIFSTILFCVVISGVSILYSYGYRDFDLVLREDSFEVSGMYGDEWTYNDIVQVELLEEMPNIKWKENGFGLSTRAKGHFDVDGHGSSLLFIHKDSSPYLYIKLENHKDIFINTSNSDEILDWYEKLKEYTN